MTDVTLMMRILITSLLALAVLFSSCETPDQKKQKAKQAALKKKTKANLRESEDVDFQAFVSRLRKAAANRDKETLKSMMTEAFGYKLKEASPVSERDWQGFEPANGGPGVFQYWDDQNLWPELDGILSEKFVKKKVPGAPEFLVAPPQFADPSLNYDGYRAGITRIKGSWKFAYFVNGTQ